MLNVRNKCQCRSFTGQTVSCSVQPVSIVQNYVIFYTIPDTHTFDSPASLTVNWRRIGQPLVVLLAICMLNSTAVAREYHVSKSGDDANSGSARQPLQTISAAAEVAQPGDTVIVHEGTYRERINPPRGGTSPDKRIVYRAAEGADVTVKGSEPVQNWTHVKDGVWKTTLPDSFFGAFNPFARRISGHWYGDHGTPDHRGWIFINGKALEEVPQKETVLNANSDELRWFALTPETEFHYDEYLMNVSSFRPENGPSVDAGSFSQNTEIQTASSSDGGKLVGWINAGDRVKYNNVDFDNRSTEMSFRVASKTAGGRIDIHLNEPDGKQLGTVAVSGTGGWQDWTTVTADIKTTSGTHSVWLLFRPLEETPYELPEDKTIIWANFGQNNPNEERVEVTTEPAVFYPSEPGRNYISIRGFTMSQAATQWAPPTEEQIGLIGTHWSKGWIIENNTVRHSRCTGITLGKYEDDLNEEQSAEGYIETIKQALKDGWSKERIGGHVVRNNHISHCGQAGIVGSMGGAFSMITDNKIHHIHLTDNFGGAEMAGIKLHGPVDTLIARNHIFKVGKFGIWIDWMANGTRITRNVLHDNQASDLFTEVNHGATLIDHNLFLSDHKAIRDWSAGGAFVHNLIRGKIKYARPGRKTPYLKPHSTRIAGIARVAAGDERFVNNIFSGHNGLTPYNSLPDEEDVIAHSNLYLNGASPSKHDQNATVMKNYDPGMKLVRNQHEVQLQLDVQDRWWTKHRCTPVTTRRLQPTRAQNQPFLQANGNELTFPQDYRGTRRDPDHPVVGPFDFSEPGTKHIPIRHWK